MALTDRKTTLSRLLPIALAAGALAVAAPSAAHAQVAFGVRVGPVVGAYGPAYVRPMPPAAVYGYGYAPAYGYGYDRDAYARHEAWERHEYMEHHRDFDDRRDYDRGRRDWDRR